jgi:beta-lactam-binding protein with PASTA domain
MVPDVKGMELANAIIELQDKGLYAGVQLRYSQKLSEKGTVIGQEPSPGSIVKAKSRVSLKVSKGAAVEKLDNYVGWNIEELEAHLKSLESVYGPLLKLKKPYIRVYDEKPAGTIIEQKPEPGTELTVLTELELVVSKGPEGQTTAVREYAEMGWQEAFREVISEGHPFIFTVNRSAEGEPGTIISQSPPPEQEVSSSTLRQLIVKPPEEIEDGHRFGILERELPEYQVAVPITVHAILPNGEKEEMISFSHKGGLLTIPYLQEKGSTIVVNIDDEEEIRHEVPEGGGVE